jgi:adenylate cyclase class 2
MENEFRTKIMDIDVDAVQKRLKDLGATTFIKRKMRRRIYNVDVEDQDTWMRLRDDGETVLLTVKDIFGDDLDDDQEVEIVVDDFDKTDEMLNKLGYASDHYQENERISYHLDDVTVDIDFWPKIPAYAEIRGPAAEEVEKVIKKLGFDMADTDNMSVTRIYKKHGLNLHEFKELKFGKK